MTDGAHFQSEESLTSKGDRDAAALGAEGFREQDALTYRGQRRVNLLWEGTQACIAISTVCAVLALALMATEIPQVLQNMVFLIIGAYFSRTNHEKIGGVGQKPPTSPYAGR